MKKTIFIGPAGRSGVPKDGAAVKNYYITKFLSKRQGKLIVCDTEGWKKNPVILLKIVFVLLFNPNAFYIVSANNTSSYWLIKIMSFFRIKDLVYWVIGGSIADWIESGKVKKESYRSVRLFIVEGERMRNTLERCGFSNAIVVPNFKVIDKLPKLDRHDDSRIIKFVFLSRILPDKGCDLIFEACSYLNNKGYENVYKVDFYGPIADEYKDVFFEKVNIHNNVNYCGFIDLRDTSNYGQLADYDVMLFPTFWHGEGFPGIFIDAFISGLPVLATDWSMNGEVIKNEKNGWLIESKNSEALTDKMEMIINGKYDLNVMREECQGESAKYNMETVLSQRLLDYLYI